MSMRVHYLIYVDLFFSSRRRHTRCSRDWSSDVCSSDLHQATNSADGFVPGVATWHLAPLSMKWEGRTKAQICEQMKDPARNGGRRTGEEVIEHMKVDPLVLWAWAPGKDRSVPPLSHEAFVAALEVWVRAGMPCQQGG